MFPRARQILPLLALLGVALGGLAIEDRVHRVTHDPLPQTQGRIALAGLQAPVTVYRDDWGAPHILAKTDEDGLFAVGYVSAQERLFQMDFLRRIATGRLAEVVGPGGLAPDKEARVVGFGRIAEASIPLMSEETRRLGEAYAAGVNAYLADATLPVEFQVLGYTPEPWTLRDSLALGLWQSWGLSADWRNELGRAAVDAERGRDVTEMMMPGLESWGAYIISPAHRDYRAAASPAATPPQQAAVSARVGTAARTLLAAIPPHSVAPAGGYASNNWVVAGSKTASGFPILANDPHLAIPMPAVWMEVHLETPTIKVTGVLFPGIPIVPLGHNRHVAWGATTTIADTQDLYVEQPHPEDPEHLYVVPGGVKSYEVVHERILVKGGSPSGGTRFVDLNVRISRHGPIINDLVEGLPADVPPLALRWTGLEPGDQFASFLAMSRARTWAEFKAGLDSITVPIQNWVFASIGGDIAFVAAGHIPIRAPGHDPTRPVPGHTDAFEWRGMIPPDELPQVVNPPTGYIGSANNKVVPPAYPYYVQSGAAGPYRATRIHELLEDATDLTIEDMARMQLDDYMVAGRRLAPHFVRAARAAGTDTRAEAAALAALAEWDYHASVDSVGATVFHAVANALRDAVLEDELSPELYAAVFRRGLGSMGLLDRMCNEGWGAALWDDRRTDAIETPDAVQAAAFKAAVAELSTHLGGNVDQWTWGRVHQQQFFHLFSEVAPWQGVATRDAETARVTTRLRHAVMDRFFGAGPFPLAGTSTTLNASYIKYLNGRFDPVWGVSWRHIVDMADVTGSAVGVITTGNSGHLASPHYRDQIPLWMRGEYHPMPMNFAPGAVEPERTLVLVPATTQGGVS